jgi:dTMP kinase
MKKRLKSGILISIEGIDGSGKSILCDNLELELSKNYDVLKTKEPGGSQLGQNLREILQHKKVCPLSEYLLYAADRAQHFNQLIIPALKENKLIISDRMADSSLAYQGYGRKIDIDFIKRVNDLAMQGIKPNLTLYLKIDTKTAKERIDSRNLKLTIMEQEELNFMQSVKDAFETIFKDKEHVRIIDAKQNPDKILNEALTVIETWIQEQNLI